MILRIPEGFIKSAFIGFKVNYMDEKAQYQPSLSFPRRRESRKITQGKLDSCFRRNDDYGAFSFSYSSASPMIYSLEHFYRILSDHSIPVSVFPVKLEYFPVSHQTILKQKSLHIAAVDGYKAVTLNKKYVIMTECMANIDSERF